MRGTTLVELCGGSSVDFSRHNACKSMIVAFIMQGCTLEIMKHCPPTPIVCSFDKVEVVDTFLN